MKGERKRNVKKRKRMKKERVLKKIVLNLNLTLHKWIKLFPYLTLTKTHQASDLT